MSFQENIVHASDSLEAAEVELKRFFRDEELFDYRLSVFDSLYATRILIATADGRAVA